MYEGELHLSLDDNYGVAVTVDDVDTSGETWKTSSGQTLAIILAFILGILDIAKSQSKEEDDLLKGDTYPVSYTHLRAHETRHDLVCRLLLEKKKYQICLLYTSWKYQKQTTS